jgi:GxxExxY protein
MPIIQMKKEVIFPELSYKICGLCFNIHNSLGRYLNEKQYGDALENLLKENNISYDREIPLPQAFKGEKERRNIADFVVDNKIIVELKAKDIVLKNDYYQIMRYLVSFNKKLGIIFNFRQKVLRPKRILNSEANIA